MQDHLAVHEPNLWGKYGEAKLLFVLPQHCRYVLSTLAKTGLFALGI